MVCSRCKALLKQYEEQFIIWKNNNVCVCKSCFEDIRKENIENQSNDN